MTPSKELNNRVAARRSERRWSQQELADRSGLSRAEISAIETGRVVPGAAAAIELAKVFCCSVEELFYFGSSEVSSSPDWFADTPAGPCRYWEATVEGRTLRVPVEATHAGVVMHHGHWNGSEASLLPDSYSDRILLMAGCDPSSAMLAAEMSQRFGFGLIPLMRSTGEAIALLKNKTVHVGGLHAGTPRIADSSWRGAWLEFR